MLNGERCLWSESVRYRYASLDVCGCCSLHVSWSDTSYIWLVYSLARIQKEHHKDICLKVIGLCLQVLFTTLHSSTNTNERTYAFSQGNNKHELLTTTTKQGRSNIHSDFYICFIENLKHKCLSINNKQLVEVREHERRSKEHPQTLLRIQGLRIS